MKQRDQSPENLHRARVEEARHDTEIHHGGLAVSQFDVASGALELGLVTLPVRATELDVQPMLDDDEGEPLGDLAGGDSIFGEPPRRRTAPEEPEEAAGEGSGGIPWPAPPRRDGGRG